MMGKKVKTKKLDKEYLKIIQNIKAGKYKIQSVKEHLKELKEE